ELPSWRAFRTEEPQQQQQKVVKSNPGDAWKSFTDPNPLRELPAGAAADSASRTLASTAPPAAAAAWGATFGSSSGVEAMPSPTVSGDGLPEWTAFGGTVSPSSSPQPLASSMPPPPTDTSQFTTGNDVWGDGPSAAVDNGRSGHWEAFNSDAPPKAGEQTLASPLDEANRVCTATTDLITLNDDSHAVKAHQSPNQASQR
ncbi:hypothetical protein FOZ62_001738, partial [Perkinsus olseni]